MASKDIRATNQIAKVQTAKKCISLMDKLKVVDPRHYAQIHAKGEAAENGYKQNSLIQIIIQDYSNGTGANNVKVSFNLSPEQIQFVLTRVSAGFSEFDWQLDKIYGEPDASGYCEAQQFRIKRSVCNERGEIQRSPWNIFISNGRGIKIQNQAGGAYMKGGSYQKRATAFIQLTDMDLYMLLKRADSYINAWEFYAAGQVMAQGMELYNKASAEAKQYERSYNTYQEVQVAPQQAVQNESVMQNQFQQSPQSEYEQYLQYMQYHAQLQANQQHQ